MPTDLEQVLLKARKHEALAYMAAHPVEIKPALRWAVSDHPCHGWRAAWLLTHCIDDNDKRVRPFIGAMLARLSETSDQHRRELLKILLIMKLNDDQEGTLFNEAVTLWENTDHKPALRFYAMNFILTMVRKYPELRSEVQLLAQPHYLKPLSSGIRAVLMRKLRQVLPQSE